MKKEVTRINEKRQTSELYEIKVPYIVTDGYGNEATLYRKEIYAQEDLESKKQDLLARITEIDETLSLIKDLA